MRDMPLPTSADLTYTDRDYATVLALMIGDIPNKTQDWTNTNSTELGIAILELVSEAYDKLSFSLDNHALETFLPTAIALPNVQAILRSIDYDMHRNIAATVNLVFTLSGAAPSPITIPAGTIVATQSGVQFVTGTTATIMTGARTPVQPVLAYQGMLHIDGPYTSNGAPDQTYQLTYANVADNFLQVTVNGVPWTEEKFIPNFPAILTTIYRATENISGLTTLEFDQYFGQAPTSGQQITASYVSTDPTQGSVGAGLLTTIVSAVTVPANFTLSVTNPTQSTQGIVRETVQQASVNGPRALRTLQRAVTLPDFLDFVESYEGIGQANAVQFAGFVAIFVQLSPLTTGGPFPLFKVEPPVQLPIIAQSTGGSLNANTTYYVAVTALDANGNETNYLPTNPSGGGALNNPAVVTTGGGGNTYSLAISLQSQLANQTSYNVYAGLSPSAMYLVNGTPLTPPTLTVNPYVITVLANSGTIAPIVNLAGGQNPATNDSYYNDLWQLLTPKRLICTAFDLYNASTAPQNLSMTILCQPNYRQIDVQNQTTSVIQNYFQNWQLGQSFFLSGLINYILQNSPGVLNVVVTYPTGDVALSPGQYAILGTLTLNMIGGSQ